MVDNINIQKQVNKGNGNLYKPEPDETRSMFNNSENNKIENIEYIGDMESNIKQLKISNQGGIVAFRYSNDKISEYISNDEEINHSELMQKSNITEEELKTKLNFDITIKLKSGKQYKANISLDIPVEGIIEKGTTSTEITNFEGIIFKRIKN